jgi:hypothetical protein
LEVGSCFAEDANSNDSKLCTTVLSITWFEHYLEGNMNGMAYRCCGFLSVAGALFFVAVDESRSSVVRLQDRELSTICGGDLKVCVDIIQDPNGANCDSCQSGGPGGTWVTCSSTHQDDTYRERNGVGNSSSNSEKNCGGNVLYWTNNVCNNPLAPNPNGPACLRTYTDWTNPTVIPGINCSGFPDP